MGAKASKLLNANLITKILLVLIILNIGGDVLSAAWLLSDPSLREGSVNGSLISSFAGNDGVLMITSGLLVTYAVVYAIASFGLFCKSKWALPLIIAISIVNRAFALVIFQLAWGFVIWSAWKIVMISLAFSLLRKT
jgi:hypothetical protein